jgi:alkyldihydroxyacetonephosphate synthase
MTQTRRERSLWGWGWADRFPTDEARRSLGAQVAALLGIDPPALRAPPTLDSIALTAPRVEVPTALGAFVTRDRGERAMHAHGKSYRDVACAFDGDFSAAPDAVAMPRDESEVAAVLEWCERGGIAVVPFGGGTSVVGGVEPPTGDSWPGAVAVDTRRMDRLLDVDEVSRAARIEAGALGPRIEEQLAAHGLTLRHFPQSFEHSTLGGWIATRAGGHFATLYTHIDDLVESVRMVTPRGVFATRRLPASGAGPAPDRLVLGSEGTLGIITEAWMRVRPRPRFRASASVRFADFMAGAMGARAVAQSGLHPSNCRLLDPREAMMNGVAAEGGAVLLLAFESAEQPMRAWIDAALGIAVGHGGVASRVKETADSATTSGRGAPPAGDGGADANAAWRQAFVDAPYVQSALVSMGIIADTFETACTWDRFPGLHQRVTAEVQAAMRAECGGGLLTCRFTHVYPDGPAPYFTFVAPGRRGQEIAQWEVIKRAASDALEASGATTTHHHAIGRLHKPWYEREVPPLFLEALRAAKARLDPAGIMNPGVLFDR